MASDDTDAPRTAWLGPWLKGFPATQPPLPMADVAQRGGQRTTAPAGWRVTGMNDQHAYLRWHPAETDGPAVGEHVALGPSHPCTTFDKWAWMAVVDEHDRVVDAITTHFA